MTKPASLNSPPTDNMAPEKEIRPPIITCRRFNNIKIIVNELIYYDSIYKMIKNYKYKVLYYIILVLYFMYPI